jgi:hypothetical protein
MAPGKGLASAGQAIQQVGQQAGAFFEEFAKRKQGATDLAAKVGFESERAEFDRKLQAELLTVSDEKEWVPLSEKRWGEFIGGQEDRLSSMSSDERLKLEGSHGISVENSLIKTHAGAFKKEQQRNQATIDVGGDDLARNGNSPGNLYDIKKLYENAVATNTYDPKVAEAKIEALYTKADAFQVRNDIARNPWDAEDDIKAQIKDPKWGYLPNSSSDQLNAYLNNAQGAQSEIRTANANEYVKTVIDLKKGEATDEQVAAVYAQAESDEEDGLISARHLEEIYLSLYNQSKKRKDISGFADVNTLVNRFEEDPTDTDGGLRKKLGLEEDANAEKVREALLDAVQSAGYGATIEPKLLNRILDAGKKESTASEAKKTALRQVDRLWTTGVFHKTAGVDNKDDTDVDKQNKANKVYHQSMQNLEDFYDKNPDATIDELYSAAMNTESYQNTKMRKAQELAESGGGYTPSEGSKIKRVRASSAKSLNDEFPGAGITPDMTLEEVYRRISASGGVVTPQVGAFINEAFPR